MTDNDAGRIDTAAGDDQVESHVPDPGGAVLEWVTHPVRRRPFLSVLVTLFILCVAAVAYYTTESRLLGVLALVVLFASLAKFYLPTRFRLTDRQVTIKSTTQTIAKPWKQFRSFYPDKNGVLLSPFVRPSRLESFRGMFLMFEENRDEVVAFVEKRVGSDLRESATTKETDSA